MRCANSEYRDTLTSLQLYLISFSVYFFFVLFFFVYSLLLFSFVHFPHFNAILASDPCRVTIQNKKSSLWDPSKLVFAMAIRLFPGVIMTVFHWCVMGESCIYVGVLYIPEYAWIYLLCIHMCLYKSLRVSRVAYGALFVIFFSFGV